MTRETSLSSPEKLKKLLTWLDQQLKERGWTDSQLAKKAGISHSVISKARSGVRPIGWDACVAIANALGFPEDTVLRVAGLLSPLPDESEETRVFNHLFSQLDEGDKEDVIDLIEAKIRRKEARDHARQPRPKKPTDSDT